MSCIAYLHRLGTGTDVCYRPREGYELHPRRPLGPAGPLSYRPREGYELHRG